MVGAGIFALLGQAGAIAGSAVWLSFLLAGLIAGLLGYTLAKLGVRYPSSGGLVAYLMEGFGRGHITGVASWLFYFAGLIVTAMVAVSFGSYGASLFFGDDAATAWVNVLATVVVVAMVAVNGVGPGTVAKVQSIIVVVLLLVFAVFIAVTLADADWDLLAPSTYPSAADIVASVALTFFAYIGFAVISFTAASLRDPARELPRAMYLGIGMTAAIYVLVSLGTFGALTPDEVERVGDTALAHAAEPALGRRGLHDDGDRGAPGDVVVGERQPLRGREHHIHARERASVPARVRPALAARRPERPRHLGRPRARAREPVRPHRHREHRQRRRDGDLPAGLRRRAAPATS